LGELKKTIYSEISCITLGSRKNLCINEKVLSLSDVSRINDKCSELQQKSGPKCPFKSVNEKETLNFVDRAHASIQDIEDLRKLGENMHLCPYYGTRASVDDSQVWSIKIASLCPL
jgi:chromosome transmission fidelity protein 1